MARIRPEPALLVASFPPHLEFADGPHHTLQDTKMLKSGAASTSLQALQLYALKTSWHILACCGPQAQFLLVAEGLAASTFQRCEGWRCPELVSHFQRNRLAEEHKVSKSEDDLQPARTIFAQSMIETRLAPAKSWKDVPVSRRPQRLTIGSERRSWQ